MPAEKPLSEVTAVARVSHVSLISTAYNSVASSESPSRQNWYEFVNNSVHERIAGGRQRRLFVPFDSAGLTLYASSAFAFIQEFVLVNSLLGVKLC